MSRLSLIFIAALLLLPNAARPDFAGPTVATRAVSPDSNLVVRIEKQRAADLKVVKYKVSYYEYDGDSDSYRHTTSFDLGPPLSQLLFVSDAGDLLFVSLAERDAVRLYSKAGKLVKTWSLGDFLSKEEIDGCAQTGSTLQWFESGGFVANPALGYRAFHLAGPAKTIKALHPPLTVMRGADPNVSFEATIDMTTTKITKAKRND
jgi:hypothetical protein